MYTQYNGGGNGDADCHDNDGEGDRDSDNGGFSDMFVTNIGQEVKVKYRQTLQAALDINLFPMYKFSRRMSQEFYTTA